MRKTRVALTAALTVLGGVLVVLVLLARSSIPTPSSNPPSSNPLAPNPLATNPVLYSGTPLSGPAAGFTLTDQFGQNVSLSSFRGKVVILAFSDSQCTTVCPLTTTAMTLAKAMLGVAGSRVQLLGIDANPDATAVSDVRAYSRAHGMLHQWRFLTAPLPRLKRVWKGYGIAVQILHGQIDHTPALFVISPAGRLERLFVTQMSYASVPQLGQLLAHEASSLLPGHPVVHSRLSYAQVTPVAPTGVTTLTSADGGTVPIGRGTARLQVFFATWDSQVLGLRRQLEALNRYEAARSRSRLPPLVAVDERSVEPSPRALPALLASLSHPLRYPVAIDASGRVADGYEVQDQPWFVLTSRTGRILWYYDVATQGVLDADALSADVRAALRRPPRAVPASAVPAELAGSPAPLAALHAQAGQLLGFQGALMARLRSLRGYPVVLNVWQSACAPCRQEFSLFASASARYGRRVAFLGVDASDLAPDAKAFLARHPVSYPSYQSTIPQLASLTAIAFLPTTVFLDAAGRIVYVHTGQYETEGTLDQDLATYAGG